MAETVDQRPCSGHRRSETVGRDRRSDTVWQRPEAKDCVEETVNHVETWWQRP